ncbi:MAG: hypothetical protein AAF799_06815 [Myxococcota bacterium]
MSLRAIVLGCVGIAVGVTGCFEENTPVVITTSSDPETGATEDGDTVASPAEETAAETPETTTTQGSSPTTEDPDGTATEPVSTEDTGPDPTTGCQPECDELACGMETNCGMSCGECAAMAQCADDQTYCGLPIGFPNDFGDVALVNGLVQLGFRFQVFEPRIVRRLGVIAGGAGQQVRLALYDSDGAGPDQRVVQTGAVELFAAGPNEFNVGATEIEPGEYWVFLHTSAMTPLARTFNGDNDYEEGLRVSIPFDDGFPEVMDDEMIIQDYRYNVYMVVED